MIAARRSAAVSGALLAIACIWMLWSGFLDTYLTQKQNPLSVEDDSLDKLQSPTIKGLFGPGTLKPPGSNYSRTLVVPKLKDDDVSWIHEEIPVEIEKAIYVMDDPTAEFHPPWNKGRESMAYLTYIIDHYDSLPDVILFFHAHRRAWHNNVLLNLDSAPTIRRLNPERVTRMGYMNARCHHDPGCPDWLHLDRPEVDWDPIKKKEERDYTVKIWEELHPHDKIPPVLSQPCCAQFAVSRARVLANPLSQYHHYRNWLMRTELDDQTSGRIMEYTWHYIFTRNAEYCPATHSCYCDGYGYCFGNNKNWQDWLDLLRKREILDAQLELLKTNGTVDTEVARVQKEGNEINNELNRQIAAADEAGKDPANRMIEAEKVF